MKIKCPYCGKKAKESKGDYYAASNDDKHYCVSLNRRVCKKCGAAFFTIEAVDLNFPFDNLSKDRRFFG